VHCYDDVSAPRGVQLFDASKLLLRKYIFRNRKGSLAPFSDVYRTLILQSFPVLWLDTDIFLLRPFDFEGSNILSQEGRDESARPNNAVMRLSKNHPILLEILDRWQRPWTAIPWGKPRKAWPVVTMGIAEGGFRAQHLPWGALGFLAIEKVIRNQGFDGRILNHTLSLTNHKVPLFLPIANAAAHLEGIAYVHLYRSQASGDLTRPADGSIYGQLWNIS
jgi:hypothetical protein